MWGGEIKSFVVFCNTVNENYRKWNLIHKEVMQIVTDNPKIRRPYVNSRLNKKNARFNDQALLFQYELISIMLSPV